MKFEINKTYYCRSVAGYDCIFEFTVVRRTAKTVYFTSNMFNGQVKGRRVKEHNGIEWVKPLGSYSMAPTLDADKVLEVKEEEIIEEVKEELTIKDSDNDIKVDYHDEFIQAALSDRLQAMPEDKRVHFLKDMAISLYFDDRKESNDIFDIVLKFLEAYLPKPQHAGFFFDSLADDEGSQELKRLMNLSEQEKEKACIFAQKLDHLMENWDNDLDLKDYSNPVYLEAKALGYVFRQSYSQIHYKEKGAAAYRYFLLGEKPKKVRKLAQQINEMYAAGLANSISRCIDDCLIVGHQLTNNDFSYLCNLVYDTPTHGAHDVPSYINDIEYQDFVHKRITTQLPDNYKEEFDYMQRLEIFLHLLDECGLSSLKRAIEAIKHDRDIVSISGKVINSASVKGLFHLKNKLAIHSLCK